ncbi:ABC transporter permease/M1 family aminopeptidase [Sphingobacterium sp. IITKGP-BTPF85]|uniref:ABC transporter permease/M1 family aminopeptidase n=1 Tax=Sphingobacterium sp. IITKGP-BTPF85 TaxID=1338009 RepID=UPI000389E331|nr:M1 family aminopeptidase [Sphingobacterium sp. IITKGP-BTPF85]KKX48455.1 membrane protein [Sphingobacterium sp. IITKGP-BTPF85]
MFSTIFKFEFTRWFKNSTIYIYMLLFFVLALFIMLSALGIFDGITATTSSNTIMNSPLAISEMINGMSNLIYFLIPTIVGASVYRDFQYNVHSILFSYPFTKTDYLLGKFFGSLSVVLIIVLTSTLGIIVAQYVPGINQSLLGPVHVFAYFQTYLIQVIPNLIIFSSIIFVLVTLTRNVYVGFVAVLILLLLQAVVQSTTADMDNRYLGALIDPFGDSAISYYTQYWSPAEKDIRNLPFTGAVIYNRLIWLAVSSLFIGGFYLFFSFSQQAFTFKTSKIGKRVTKNNFESIFRMDLPVVKYNFSAFHYFKTSWALARYNFSYIVKNPVFMILTLVGILFVILMASTVGSISGTSTYPVTWKMLMIPGSTFKFFLLILTFLFTGLLIHRGNISRMGGLIDASPVPNWVLLLSTLIAIIKMQLALLLVVIVTCMAFQVYHGYYTFEIGQYVMNLMVYGMLSNIAWLFVSVFVHTLFKNYLTGFFVLLLLFIALPFLSAMGVEQNIYKFNQGPGLDYSDMDGFGYVLPFLTYRLYWLLFSVFFVTISLLLWRRGLFSGIKERWLILKSNLNPTITAIITVSLVGFIAMGAGIYYENNIKKPYYTSLDHEKQAVEWEKKYKKYQYRPQPRVVDVKFNMDIYPKERSFKAQVAYVLKNKTGVAIDSIFVNYNDYDYKFSFSVPNTLVSEDDKYNFNIYKLQQPLAPGDSITLNFSTQSPRNTWVNERSPVKGNGTFINNMQFPNIGYLDRGELVENDIRKKYGLPHRNRMAPPTDQKALQNNYISNDADWIRFEAIVSTDLDQLSIAPGYLTKEWEKGGRKYYHYKMDTEILNFYAFNSARYEVKKDNWNGVKLEVYYHKGHTFNLDRMMASSKASLAYYSQEYSAYPHRQLRIVEFPLTDGTFAQSFANTIPFSEAIGFIADVKEKNEDAVDYPYAVTAHEIAHQWWAHQVVGANVQGATLLSESMSEYSSLKVLEKRYGKGQMRKFLKDALDGYLTGRSAEKLGERPLMFNENQMYIHYQKGSLVLYALSDYLGEDVFNKTAKTYLEHTAFQNPPYTTSLEFVEHFKQATPDSLQYLIKDMFETITLYNNKVEKVTAKKMKNGKYQVDIEFEVAKYRVDENGKKSYHDKDNKPISFKKSDKDTVESLPLRDYIEIGVFAKTNKKDGHSTQELYLKKHRIDQINNKITLVVDELPLQVGIDPYNKLIDMDSDDNRKDI